LTRLERDPRQGRRLTAVLKTLALLEADPHDPQLHGVEWHTLKGSKGETVYEVHAETRTAAEAHRVFWHRGPIENYIIVLAITPYP